MYSQLYEMLPDGIIRENEPMKNHTTFKIGGPVDLMVFPGNYDDIKNTLIFGHQHNIPVLVFGLGSNILVRDKGLRGIAIKIGNNLKKVEINGSSIYAEAGIQLSQLARKAVVNSLSGLEFAEGIPGSLGGAVVMNAGAYNDEMGNLVKEVQAISATGEIRTFNVTELNYSYRKSAFQENGYTVVSAHLELQPRDQTIIMEKMKVLASRRKEKQPLEYPSAGSVFKRPVGYYVGPMIEKLGLKGYRIGGAEVSNKHAGFIVNRGGATAADVLALISKIQSEVQQQFGVDLQTEIKIIGEE